MGRKKLIKKLCRYCNKKKEEKNFARHRCIGKEESKEYWRRWKEDYPGEHSKYPTFEAYDQALLEGSLSPHGNPYGPPDPHDPPPGESDMGYEQDSEPGIQEVDTGSEGIPLEDRAPTDDTIQYIGSPGPVTQEVQDLTQKEETPPSVGMADALKEGLHIAKGGVDEVIKYTAKNRSWMFIVQVVHSVQMFVFNAKERNTDFKLTKRHKKLLSEAYQATFGDSPLANLKVTGQGEWANHIVVAQWDVYGDFYIENLWGLVDRGKWIRDKIKARSERKRNEREQEDIDHENISQG